LDICWSESFQSSQIPQSGMFKLDKYRKEFKL